MPAISGPACCFCEKRVTHSVAGGSSAGRARRCGVNNVGHYGCLAIHMGLEGAPEIPFAMAEDAVVEACDVYINTSLMSHLHLLQLPSPKTAELLTDLRSVFGQDAVLSARFKPKSGLLEIDVPVDTASDTFDRDRAEAFARSAVDASNTDAVLDHKRLSGMCFPCSSGIVAVGATFQGRLFLTPVSSIVPMHVDLGHLDAADANERAASKKQATEDPDKLKPVQVPRHTLPLRRSNSKSEKQKSR